MQEDDLERYSLTEILRLQNELSKTIQRRFRKNLAITFSDVVGSTAYFQRFGNEVGRRLLQRSIDLVTQVVGEAEGRIVDTAGDGVFCCFPGAEVAANAMIKLEWLISQDNAGFEHDHQLVIRVGLHWGPVLTDGEIVTGDAVNICARIASEARSGEICLSNAAFQELPANLRARTNLLRDPLDLKGIADPVTLYSLEWRDLEKFPNKVLIEETEEEVTLPNLDLIRFGRLEVEADGRPANEVVLLLADPDQNRKISRRHFALRRHPDGYRLRQISHQRTEVDGVVVPYGSGVDIKPGSVACLSDILTLTFLSVAEHEDDADRTSLYSVDPVGP